jgi:arsenite oxidase small subunit
MESQRIVGDAPRVNLQIQASRPLEDQDSGPITRRGFCNGLLFTSAALLAAGEAAVSSAAATNELASPPLRIEGAEALMPGSALLFSYPSRNEPAILVRMRDGRYYAYSQKCSHLGCSVEFDRNLGCFRCPCHQGTYDAMSGAVLHGPPPRPLDQIFLQTRGGEVWAVGRRSDCEPLIAGLTTRRQIRHFAS